MHCTPDPRPDSSSPGHQLLVPERKLADKSTGERVIRKYLENTIFSPPGKIWISTGFPGILVGFLRGIAGLPLLLGGRGDPGAMQKCFVTRVGNMQKHWF